jgi:hypothetical protein
VEFPVVEGLPQNLLSSFGKATKLSANGTLRDPNGPDFKEVGESWGFFDIPQIL